MALKIVRNDITQMNVEAIVNTANPKPVIGEGCDRAVYDAAGSDKLLWYRRENIGEKAEGEVFVTPAFDLKCKIIIHAVSPFFRDGSYGEENKLRSCYKKALEEAAENKVKSVAFPLIATGSYRYPKEDSFRVALEEINAFLLSHSMDVYLAVFDEESVELGKRITPDLEEYIDRNYVSEVSKEEYTLGKPMISDELFLDRASTRLFVENNRLHMSEAAPEKKKKLFGNSPLFAARRTSKGMAEEAVADECAELDYEEKTASASGKFDYDELINDDYDGFEEGVSEALKERMAHITDTFSEYLLYLIGLKGMNNADVYKRAFVDKKVFSKIKNNRDAHPQKITALCLCVGAKLNLDETKDLLARAGYALSPCDKTDIIFSYFIENEIYNIIEIDIQLEEHGLNCIVES